MLSSPVRKILRPLVVAAVAGALAAAVLPPPRAEAATPTYVIATVGDSWASGEGNTPYTNSACHRSASSYSHQVVLPDGRTVKTGVSAGTASFDFRACSGATTANLLTTNQVVGSQSMVPQLLFLNPKTTHVFVSISGNDLDFVSILSGCLVTEADCRLAIQNAKDFRLNKALKGLTDVVKKIRSSVPQAQIIVTGYAPLVGTSSLWGSKATILKSFALEFNNDQRDTVKALQRLGIDVDFVDIAPTFEGHGNADTKTSWFFAPVYYTPGGWSTSTLHPTPTGVEQIAKLVSKVVEKPYTGSCSGNVALGATGNCVREIQNHLNAWGKSLSVDGSFGPATKAAVVSFQGAHGLTADGIVGPKTKAVLFTK